MKYLRLLTLFFFFLVSFTLPAQAGEVDMADAMRASGKIYVVVAVLSTVMTGIIIYLVLLDRRLSRLEKKTSGNKPA